MEIGFIRELQKLLHLVLQLKTETKHVPVFKYNGIADCFTLQVYRKDSFGDLIIDAVMYREAISEGSIEKLGQEITDLLQEERSRK